MCKSTLKSQASIPKDIVYPYSPQPIFVQDDINKLHEIRMIVYVNVLLSGNFLTRILPKP